MSVAYDVGAFLYPLTVLGRTTGTTAATAATSIVVDQRTLGQRYHSIKAVVPFSYVKTSGAAITSVQATMQHSLTTVSSDFATLGTAGTAVSVAVGAGTGTTAGKGVAYADVSLHNARRYLRLSVVKQRTLATQALNLIGVLMFGGADENPPAS